MKQFAMLTTPFSPTFSATGPTSTENNFCSTNSKSLGPPFCQKLYTKERRLGLSSPNQRCFIRTQRGLTKSDPGKFKVLSKSYLWCYWTHLHGKNFQPQTQFSCILAEKQSKVPPKYLDTTPSKPSARCLSCYVILCITKQRSTAECLQHLTDVDNTVAHLLSMCGEECKDGQGTAPVFRSLEIGEENTSIPHMREVRTKSHPGSSKEETGDSSGCDG